MDDDSDRGWTEWFAAVATNSIIPTMTSSFPASWNRSRKISNSSRISGPVLGTNTSSQSPRPEDKQSKRRRSSAAGEKNKWAKTVVPKLSLVAMTTGPPSGPVRKLLLEQSPRSEDKQSKRRRSSAAGKKNKRAKTAVPKLSLVAMTIGPPSGPIIDTVMIDDDDENTGSLPSLVGEHLTSSTAFDAAASHSSTPSALSPPSPTQATATLLPSSSTLPPAVATSSPSAAPDHEEGVPLPHSPVHWNLGENYATPSEDP
nr:mitogen-activated protein kinase 7-like [Nicotiana tomentosiformis]